MNHGSYFCANDLYCLYCATIIFNRPPLVIYFCNRLLCFSNWFGTTPGVMYLTGAACEFSEVILDVFRLLVIAYIHSQNVLHCDTSTLTI